MYYKLLGKTGVKVSSLCMGTMTFGDGADDKDCKEMYTLTRDKGVNIYDCANVYADGKSERILGKLIAGNRSEVLVTSKAYYATDEGINSRGGSRLHLVNALHSSLKRLGTDYIDIYYLHSFDQNVNIEESLNVLSDFVRDGKVLYVGLSNYAAWQMMKAVSITEYKNLAPIACIQPMYNLLKRQCEVEILPMAASERLGVLTYGPLAGGLLTGKYANGQLKRGRLNTDSIYKKRYEKEVLDHSVESFLSFAKQQGYDPVSLAIAWVNHHSSVSSVIVGARTAKQLEASLDSIEIEMTGELYKELSELTPSPMPATDRSEEFA